MESCYKIINIWGEPRWMFRATRNIFDQKQPYGLSFILFVVCPLQTVQQWCCYWHLQLVYQTIARLFLMFQKIPLPDSSFHLGFPLDFWMSWSFILYTTSLKYPVNKKLSFLPRSLALKFSTKKLRISFCWFQFNFSFSC